MVTMAPAGPDTPPVPGGEVDPRGAAGTGGRPADPGVSPAAWTAVGPRDAPAIVFIHGTRLNRRQWQPQLRRLSSRFRCIALDLPGHGAQAAVPFTLAGAVETIAAAIAAEARGPALVVGLSLGGYVAIDAAEAHPELVAGLVLAGCSAEPVGPVTAPFRGFAWAMEHLRPRALQALNIAFFRTRYGRGVGGPLIEGGFWAAGGAAALRLIIGRRYLERLGRLWTPVFVINGALDPVFGPGGEPWANACRRGRHIVIPWAAHLSNLDRPSSFARAVARAADEAFAPH